MSIAQYPRGNNHITHTQQPESAAPLGDAVAPRGIYVPPGCNNANAFETRATFILYESRKTRLVI